LKVEVRLVVSPNVAEVAAVSVFNKNLDWATCVNAAVMSVKIAFHTEDLMIPPGAAVSAPAAGV